MAIAITLKEYLADTGVDYELLKHSPTYDSTQTAAIAHIPGKHLAKAVMLEDINGRYLLAVIPANYHVDLGKLRRQFNLQLDLATEAELAKVFDDCKPGAVPPVGTAYGIDVMLDDSLIECSDIFFEGGDHIHLVHLSGRDFQQLFPRAKHASFSSR